MEIIKDMKRKLIKKYLVQGILLVLLNFFPIAIWEIMREGITLEQFQSIKKFILEGFINLIAGIFLYTIYFMMSYWIFFLLAIPVSSIFSYILDKYLEGLSRKRIKLLLFPFLRIRFFLLKYILVGFFGYMSYKMEVHLARMFLKNQDPPLGYDYVLLMCILMIILAFIFYYVLVGLVFLIKKIKKNKALI